MKILISNTKDMTPSPSEIIIGQIAINLADKKIYTKNEDNYIIELAESVTLENSLSYPTTGRALDANQGRIIDIRIDDVVEELSSNSTLIDAINSKLDSFDIYDVIGLEDALAGKEASFTKNTAFNKNFGLVAGTVAEGNHIHTPEYYTGE